MLSVSQTVQCWIIYESVIRKGIYGSGHLLSEVLYQHFPVGTEEHHEKLQGSYCPA
jgi:hypothetical protein